MKSERFSPSAVAVSIRASVPAGKRAGVCSSLILGLPTGAGLGDIINSAKPAILLISPIANQSDIFYLDDIKYGGKTMFQPRNRRIEITPMGCSAKATKFAWFSDDGDPETGDVWAWGCAETPLTVASHRIGKTGKLRYIICSDRGQYWKARGTWDRKGHLKHFATPSEAAAFAEQMS